MTKELSIAARLDAASFPHPVTHLRLLETPISWLLLTGPYAYKIKKPVHLSFIDASTLERRAFLCQEEVRLNRRFAPDLYLDVLSISAHEGRLRVGAIGTPIEYAVQMREFEPSEELGQQLSSGSVAVAELAEFGYRLARWHEAAAVAAPQEPYATIQQVELQVQDNFGALRRRVQGNHVDRLLQLEHWTRSELARLADLMRQRRSSGRVRECHGDLHAGNIVHWHGRWMPFDCLEFEPRLRWIDVISDVAFLYMDLLARSHEPLASAFLSAYLEHGGDYEGVRLLRFYSVYRALVRAKVAALASTSAASATAPLATLQCAPTLGQHLQVAERLARPQASALLLMHGVAASGKSSLSSRLIGAIGAIRVRSDLERHRLFGTGAYSMAATKATYERLHACAQHAIESGYRVVVDATFLDGARRQSFAQLAHRRSCPLVIISCTAPRPVLLARLSARRRAAEDASEATLDVLERQVAVERPLDDNEHRYVINVDTSSPDSIERALARIQTRLSSPS